jgi:hypothetical protein
LGSKTFEFSPLIVRRFIETERPKNEDMPATPGTFQKMEENKKKGMKPE